MAAASPVMAELAADLARLALFAVRRLAAGGWRGAARSTVPPGRTQHAQRSATALSVELHGGDRAAFARVFATSGRPAHPSDTRLANPRVAPTSTSDRTRPRGADRIVQDTS